VWTRQAGSGEVREGQGGLRVPPAGGAGQQYSQIPSKSSSLTSAPPTPTFARWATTTLSSPGTESGHKICDRKVGQGGDPPLAGGPAILGLLSELGPLNRRTDGSCQQASQSSFFSSSPSPGRRACSSLASRLATSTSSQLGKKSPSFLS
jgi:hypothetical protein